MQDPDRVFDELLVLGYRAGDRQALELLIKRWQRRIVAYAYRQTQNSEVARDIAQEVWIVAIRRIDQLRETNKIGSWLLSITHHKSIDWIRKNGIKGKDEMSQIEQEEADSDEITRMRSQLRKLSTDHREVLTMHYLEGLTVSEIATIMGVSSGTIKSRLYYARESLKKKLKTSNHE